MLDYSDFQKEYNNISETSVRLSGYFCKRKALVLFYRMKYVFYK